jgi:hypothetical protein
MGYGGDLSVYLEDKAGDQGVSPSPVPWWLSPDVDIPAHPGQATQGVNQVQIRVHAHEEPVLSDRVVAEVYVGNPSLVLSPANATRIDPGTLVFRTAAFDGTEPIVNETGTTVTFPWTPSASATDPGGPGHRCLVLRAFPQSVTPPNSPFDVPNEQHEAQHNIEVLSTTRRMAKMSQGGLGVPGDPRHVDEVTGLWWEELATIGVRRRGKRIVVWAFDPSPDESMVAGLAGVLKKARVGGFSADPPNQVTIEGGDVKGTPIDPAKIPRMRKFARAAGIGRGLFADDRLIAAASFVLGPRSPRRLLLRFDHSNLERGTAVVLHGAQWDEAGRPEGGMTVVAVAPARR